MSLLVAGIVSHARVDTRLAQLHVARAEVAAAGDGAIQLMLVELVAGRVTRRGGVLTVPDRFRLGALEVAVEAVPTAGLVDLNSASAEILRALFGLAAGLDAAQAQTIADNVLQWRSTAPRAGAGAGMSRFNAVEDLLRVDGVNRSLLDAVRDYVAAGVSAQAGTSWPLAPDAVLAVMQQADPQRAASILQTRRQVEQAATGPTTTRGAFRVDARVTYGDQVWLRRRWVAMASASGEDPLPWQVLRTETPRVLRQ